MLDDDHRVTGVHETVELPHQDLDVGRVQARRRLVQDVQRGGAVRPLELGRELDALRLTAGQLRRGLPEPQIAEADVEQGAQAPRRGRRVLEEHGGGLDGEVEHPGDGEAPQPHLERLGVVAGSVAVGAGRVRTGQEEQLDGDEPLALAGLAPAPGTLKEKRPAL